MSSQPQYVQIQYPTSGYSAPLFTHETPARTSYVKVVSPPRQMVYPMHNSISHQNHLTNSIVSYQNTLPVANSVAYVAEQEPLTEFRYIEYVPIEHRIIAPANTNPEMLPYLKNQKTYYVDKQNEFEQPQLHHQNPKNYVVIPQKAEYIQPQYVPANYIRASGGVVVNPQNNFQMNPVQEFYPVSYYPPQNYANLYQTIPAKNYLPNEMRKSGFTSQAKSVQTKQDSPEKIYPKATPRIYDLPNGIQTSHDNEPKYVIERKPENPPKGKFDENKLGGITKGQVMKRTRGDYESLD